VVEGDVILHIEVMPKQPTINDVFRAIKQLPTSHDLSDSIQGLASLIDDKFATKDDLKSFATKDDLSEMIQGLATHIDEKFATKDDVERFATKDDFDEMRREVATEIDRFVTLHQRVDVEYVSLRSRCDRIEDRLERNQIR
jgi:hypothetical protein